LNATEWSRFNAVCESKPQDFALETSALSTVMPGLVPGIHAFLHWERSKAWMASASPTMTNLKALNVMTRHKQQHRDSAPGGSQRQLRVGELVRHVMAEMLTRGDVHDPVIEGHLITVPEVRMTADLRLATIYVMPMGGRDAEEVVAAFERHKKFLRAEIAHRINLKFAPDIRFRVDERFAEAERIDKPLRSPEVKRDLKHDEDGE